MAQKQPPHNELLARPLYIFDLPEELLYTLTLKDASSSPPSTREENTQTSIEASRDASHEDGVQQKTTATSCNLCNLKFPTLQEQRSHVRSDFHNYNLKQQIKGLRTVGEAEFEKLVGDLDESISGSDSESESEAEANKDSTLTALLKRQAKISHEHNDVDTGKMSTVSGSPFIWFQSEKLPNNTALGVYKAIFSKEEQDEPGYVVDAVKAKQIPPAVPTRKNDPAFANGSKTSPHYFLCMIGGGHFAAMIVSLVPKVTKHTGKNERQADVLAHKTFHRYTTRRKQGGAQSASDAARGAAHSAGSSLRRYNEVALTAEVRQLLTDWRQLIESAELLFVRATGNTNRQTLFSEYEGRVLGQNDPRIRGFPFSTRRATQSELMRAFVELTRVKVSHIDEAAIAAAQEKERLKQEQSKTTPSKPAKASKPSEEEETATLHTNQIQSLIRRSKAPALLGYLKSNNLTADFTFFPEAANHHAPTLLHLAASLSVPALITALLVKGKADPTQLNADEKTAYEIAGDRATRDAFRSARYTLGEKAWDWDAATVPSALSPEESTQRTEQEKKEKAALDAIEAARRKQDLERLEKESEAAEEGQKEKKFGKGKTLTGVEKTGTERREEEARGLTPEMRMKLERERRARAAEERMRRLHSGSRD
jgi:hypothetical protein